jgi:putative transposase
MTKPIHPVVLFRISVIGALISRADLQKGELKILVQNLAKHAYDAPDGKRLFVSAKTIERWYYLWKKENIEGLEPKERCDRGKTEIRQDVQAALIELKKRTTFTIN